MRAVRSLVIVPFDAAGQPVLNAVHRALYELDIKVFRFDDIRQGASWANAITDAIRSSDFLVADISRKNPNVFYELGFAHALRKPTILIVNSEAGVDLPADLAGFQYIVYEPANLPRLVDQVKWAATPLVARAGEHQ